MQNINNNSKYLKCGEKVLDLSKPAIMAVLNVTPDSFSDGGQLFTNDAVDKDKILRTLECMVNNGADIIDLGGESTRPGAAAVSVQQELDRVIPVLEWLSKRFDAIFSVDTSSAEVIIEADIAGAHIINDVRALRRNGALDAAVKTGLPVCLMHMQNEPKSMQDSPKYKDVVNEVIQFLTQRKLKCIAAGIPEHQIILDPGFGFGKTLDHNLDLFAGLTQLAELNHPIMVGVSRKSMIGQITNTEVNDRMIGSVTMAVLAAQKVYQANGSVILRVHDVKETKQAIQIWQATRKA